MATVTRAYRCGVPEDEFIVQDGFITTVTLAYEDDGVTTSSVSTSPVEGTKGAEFLRFAGLTGVAIRGPFTVYGLKIPVKKGMGIYWFGGNLTGTAYVESTS